jgi:hypothetical protein
MGRLACVRIHRHYRIMVWCVVRTQHISIYGFGA